MRRIALFLLALLFAGAPAHATRPEYFDLMWVLAVADVCMVQNPRLREMPLAKALSQSAAPGADYWRNIDQRPEAACVRRLEKMPDQVCVAVMNLGLDMDRAALSAFRARHEVQAWRAERVSAYVEAARGKGAGTSCPDIRETRREIENEPLVEAAAACRAVAAGPEPDYRELLSLGVADLERRAKEGDVLAQNNLGRRYGLGIGVAKNSTKSAEWYRRAAEQGLGIAQSNLANMYINGEGVERDPALALEWAKKAADQGGARGQIAVGYIYLTSAGSGKDGRQAERCFLLAAKQGSVYAQHMLAKMYSRGDGVPVDPDKSVLWFQRAREAERTGNAWKE